MIYAEISDLSKYLGIHKNIDTAIHYLEHCDLKTLVAGRNEVDGDNVFINRFGYETMPEEKAFFESHEDYADIHLLVSGQEKIGVSDPRLLTEFDRNPADDFIGYHGEVENYSHMTPDKFLIAFPGEAHMVKLQYKNPVRVEKAVVKVKID